MCVQLVDSVGERGGLLSVGVCRLTDSRLESCVRRYRADAFRRRTDTQTHTHTHTHTSIHTHKYAHTHALSPSLFVFLSRTQPHRHPRTLSLTHTHTLTLSVSFSLSLSLLLSRIFCQIHILAHTHTCECGRFGLKPFPAVRPGPWSDTALWLLGA